MRFVLPPPRRFRHPLARALSLLLGLAVVGVMLVFGLFVAGVLLVGGMVLLALRYGNRGRHPAAVRQTGGNHRPEVLEGEFVVLRQGRSSVH